MNKFLGWLGAITGINLFGVEQDDEVVALALVNMIFRGDGLKFPHLTGR
ncbi:hypothetical protein [uncultured Gammaproteobacteria bacterium]|jgi:type I restriction-modification system DNA methylase subunit|nr:hypothetical protein [uncultured Gammaproteobacteria bacterium]